MRTCDRTNRMSISARTQSETRRTGASIRLPKVAAGLALATTTFFMAAQPVSAALTFATYSVGQDNAVTGSLNGVDFSVSALTDPQAITAFFSSNSNWNNDGNQPALESDTSNFTVTFDEAISGLEMYLYYFRAENDNVGGAPSYTFDGGEGNTISLSGGLSGYTLNGNTIETPGTSFVSGIISFANPVTTLTVSGGTGTVGSQAFALAADPAATPPASSVPEPASLGLVGLGLAGAVTRARVRMRRRRATGVLG